MKRILAVAALVGAILAAMTLPAQAKGEGPVGATITGPGIGGPGGTGSGPGGPGGTSNTGGGSDLGGGAAAVGTVTFTNKAGLEPFQNDAIWRLAAFSGLVLSCSSCTSYIDTSEPKNIAALGPVYHVRYFAGKCCDDSVRQQIYPFAPGGPVVFNTTDHSSAFFLLGHRTGWWHTDGRMGQLFLRFLHHAGVPKTNPLAAGSAGGAAAASASSSGAGWQLPVALAVMAMLLVAGAIAARPRSSARPA
jgi:hypothetical protein